MASTSAVIASIASTSTSTMPPLPLSSSDTHAAPMAAASTSKPISSGSSSVVHDMAATTKEVLAPPLLPPPASGSSKPLKKHKRKKKGSVSELTPLMLNPARKSSSEEDVVHPLPWFRSPELSRKSPPLNSSDKRRTSNHSRYRRMRTHEQTSLCNAIMAKVCCGLVASDTEADLEYGSIVHTATHTDGGEQLESEGFKKCVQFLVGLIVVVAAVLIIMIIFEPFQDQSSLW